MLGLDGITLGTKQREKKAKLDKGNKWNQELGVCVKGAECNWMKGEDRALKSRLLPGRPGGREERVERAVRGEQLQRVQRMLEGKRSKDAAAERYKA